VRNLFDQYTQTENRLTHALATALAEDRRLLRAFVRRVTGTKAPSGGRLEIVEQQIPGEPAAVREEEAERRGLPDAWIHDGGDWALLIESKIQAKLTRSQLQRHLYTARRRGFSDVELVAIVADRPKKPPLDSVRIIEWTGVYRWLRQQEESAWARRVTDYMEILEGRFVADGYLREGSLTVFSGIPFGPDSPYNYREAKRVLGLAMNELRRRSDLQDHLGVDFEGAGRPAITGRDGVNVWDFLRLKNSAEGEDFNLHPHLTLSIQDKRVFTLVSFPHRLKTVYRRNLLGTDREEFLEMMGSTCSDIEAVLKAVPGAVPWLELAQRHYPTQRSVPIVDARLEFDLRTAAPGPTKPKGRKGPVKAQPEWLDAVYHALSKKRSNLQFGVGAIFPYDRCKAVRTPEILDHIADTWLACGPVIHTALGETGRTR